MSKYPSVKPMSYAEITRIEEIVTKNPLTIEQIAIAQGRICRYGGRGRFFYSDAQHAYIISLIVPQKKDIVLQALMHDAPECYTGDIVWPYKRELKRLYPGIKRLEDKLQRLVFEQHGIAWPIFDEVEIADKGICKYEMEGLESTGVINISDINGDSYGFWPPEEASQRWYKRFNEVSKWEGSGLLDPNVIEQH